MKPQNMAVRNQLQQLLDNHANDSYINQCLGLSLETIADARLGIYGSELGPPIQPPTPEPAPAKTLVPVTMPFPVLDDKDDLDRIIMLTKHGLSVRKIQKHLTAPLSERQINLYVNKKLGPRRTGNSSIANWISPSFKPYAVEGLKRLGKDPRTCELCLEFVRGGCIIHHTKYEGATLYDLMYICTSCNLSRENKGLT